MKPICTESDVTKGAPKIVLRFPATDKLVTALLVNLAGQVPPVSALGTATLIYANQIKHVKHASQGGLVVTADLLARRIVIPKGVCGIPDYALNAKMVSMEVDVCVLVSVGIMVATTKVVVLPVLMGILETIV